MRTMDGLAQPPTGFLELIMGPMWSGKTSRLIDLHTQYAICRIPVLLINYKGDAARGMPAGALVSHDGRSAPCCDVAKLGEVPPEKLSAAAVVLVNEAQFFPDAATWIQEAVETHGKRVHAAGLDGDFLRRPFGPWMRLVPLADRLTKRRAFCRGCRAREAVFSHRTVAGTGVELIGAEGAYEPLCRGCYLRAPELYKSA
jgi:thymidine kinase